jgi:hypothetical protein
MSRNIKVLLVFVAVLALAGAAYGFAAGNSVPKNAAGYTANVVSGYSITNIVYKLNADTPTLVDNISFVVAPTTSGDPDAQTVKLQTALSGTWTTCDISKALTVVTATCTLPDSTAVADVTAMNIVATSSVTP